jgi:hypothetical protein
VRKAGWVEAVGIEVATARRKSATATWIKIAIVRVEAVVAVVETSAVATVNVRLRST